MDELNAAELKFLRLVCSDLTYKEIAVEMGKSPRTIDGYRDGLLKKLNVKSRTGLVLYAIRNKLIIV
jgi:DNA-binding CsgD family transcriptional regulator